MTAANAMGSAAAHGPFTILLAAATGSGSNATGSDAGHAAHSPAHDLEQLAFIWTGVLCCNILAHYTGLTAILYQLVFGSICVNTGLLPVQPSQFMSTFSELAITLIMFSLGLEEEVKHFLEGIQKAWGIALIGAMGPFTCGFLFTYWFFEGDLRIAIMSGLCMTATAVSVTMVALKGCGLSKSKASTGIMTSAVLDDIGSLALVAVAVPLVTSDDGVSPLFILGILGKAAGFFGIVFVFGKFVFPERVRLNWCCQSEKFLFKYGYRHIVRISPAQSTLVILLTGLLFGLLAHVLGFHPGIGAYMGALILKKGYFSDDYDKGGEVKRVRRGSMFGQESEATKKSRRVREAELEAAAENADSDDGEDGGVNAAKVSFENAEALEDAAVAVLDEEKIVDGDSYDALLHSVDTIAMSWVGPVFFVVLGTKLVIDPPLLLDCLWQIILLYVGMLVFQFFSASIAARYVPGGFNFVESVMIGFGMLGRAELAFVVLDIAYVQNQILTRRAFYVLMFTCFLLNVTAPVVITWWKPYYLGQKVLPYFMSEPQVGGMDAEYERKAAALAIIDQAEKEREEADDNYDPEAFAEAATARRSIDQSRGRAPLDDDNRSKPAMSIDAARKSMDDVRGAMQMRMKKHGSLKKQPSSLKKQASSSEARI